MGQYYNIITKKDDKYTVYDRSYFDRQGKSVYMMAKLTEHSWIGNTTMECFSSIILRNPQNVAWVGDYADDTELEEITNKVLTLKDIKSLHCKAHKSDNETTMEYLPIDTKYMLLVNWTKKQYISMYDYIKKNTINDWCLHPLSLLTALGNGKGGGDYHGINEELIGYWAFDEISFEDADYEEALLSQNFIKEDFEFKENWQHKEILTKEKLLEIAQNAINELETSEYEHGAILEYLDITDDEYNEIKKENNNEEY